MRSHLVLVVLLLVGIPSRGIALSDSSLGLRPQPFLLGITVDPNPYGKKWKIDVVVSGRASDSTDLSLASFPIPSGALEGKELAFGRGAFGIICDPPGDFSTRVFLLPGLAQPSAFDFRTSGTVEVENTNRAGVFSVLLQFPEPVGPTTSLGRHPWREAPIGSVRVRSVKGKIEEIYPNSDTFEQFPVSEVTFPFSRLGQDRRLKLKVSVQGKPLGYLLWGGFALVVLFTLALFIRRNADWLRAEPARRWSSFVVATLAAVVGGLATNYLADPNLWDIGYTASVSLFLAGIEAAVLPGLKDSRQASSAGGLRRAQ